MTSAYHTALTQMALNDSYLGMTHGQRMQIVQFQALEIEIKRAETDLMLCKTLNIEWPDYIESIDCECEHGCGLPHRHIKRGALRPHDYAQRAGRSLRQVAKAFRGDFF